MATTTRPPNLRRALTFYAYLARARGGFRFDTSRGEYIYNANGRTVSQAKVQSEAGRYLDHIGDNMRYQTQRMIDDKISIPDWQKRMKRELRDAWRTEYILGKGGVQNMTPADWGRMGGRLQFQYRHLNQFAQELFRGNLSPAQIQARVQLYNNACRTALYDGRTAAKKDAGFTEERRILNPAEHCADCVGYAAMDWQPIGTLPEPGEGSVCRTNCRCSKEYRTDEEGRREQLGDQDKSSANPVNRPSSAIKMIGPNNKAFDDAMGLIDQVHGMPENSVNILTRAIDLEYLPDGSIGSFGFNRRTGDAFLDVAVRNDTGTVMRTVAHEFGHYLDRTSLRAALGATEDFASESGLLSDWERAVTSSAVYKDLVAARDEADSDSRAYRDYFLTNRELFARSYAQYIARNGGDSAAMADIEKDIGIGWAWPDDDFGEIDAAFDNLFRTIGWI